MKTLAELLNHYMALKNISQAELSRRSGVADPVISRMKTGERGSTPGTIDQRGWVEQALGTDTPTATPFCGKAG